MLRHVALQPLSREHHGALVLARAARWALAGRRGTPEEVRERIVREFAHTLEPHFRDEERHLLPHAGVHATRLEADHEALRALVAALRFPLEGAEFKAALETFAERLEAHVRWEERELFPVLESSLGARELERLGPLLLRRARSC